MVCWKRGKERRQSGAVKWKMKRLLEKNADKYASKTAKVAKLTEKVENFDLLTRKSDIDRL